MFGVAMFNGVVLVSAINHLRTAGESTYSAVSSKTGIVVHLKGAFLYCDGVYSGFTDAHLNDPADFWGVKTNKMFIMTQAGNHDTLHYVDPLSVFSRVTCAGSNVATKNICYLGCLARSFSSRAIYSLSFALLNGEVAIDRQICIALNESTRFRPFDFEPVDLCVRSNS